MNGQKLIEKYMEIIIEKKQKNNVISKKIDKEDLNSLICDGHQLDKIVKNDYIIDVGSGNGILGIPLAIRREKSTIHLIEPRIKKYLFLKSVISELDLKNTDVFHQDIETFLKNSKDNCTAIARGFPNLDLLYNFLQKNKVNQLVIISSDIKIYDFLKRKNVHNHKVYDIKNREILKILSMESVSRETL